MVSKSQSSRLLSTSSLQGTAAAFPADLNCRATSTAGPRRWALPSSESPKSLSRKSWRRASRRSSGGRPRLLKIWLLRKYFPANMSALLALRSATFLGLAKQSSSASLTCSPEMPKTSAPLQLLSSRLPLVVCRKLRHASLCPRPRPT